ncbi:MAG: tetratricopeptide repeat protein, partial [Myxococcota bacterium]|nr:tetratricopeptide repeat protein [Myxococcota bacterium]
AGRTGQATKEAAIHYESGFGKLMRHTTTMVLFASFLVTAANAQDPKALKGPKVLPVQMPAGAEQEKDVNTLEAASNRFKEMAADFQIELKSLILREIRQRRVFIQKSYGKQIADIDVVERRRRVEAIAALQKFVARYPNHPKHTPDAMFRLAELFFEKSQVDHELLVQQYERDLDLYERGKVPAEPAPPKEDFAEAIKLYDEIIRRFRKYRFRDVAMYMKGYTLYRSGFEREAKAAWMMLATTYKNSNYTAEAWMRVGEYHFDFGEWKLAEKAYLSAARYPKSKFYTMVLYKLAWTRFQQYQYQKAIAGFKKLIGFYDAQKRAGKTSALGSALREEAIEYLARSLAEDDWDGDGDIDENAGVNRALSYLSEGLPFELEILEAYARALYDLHEAEKYRESARVYQVLLDRDPLDQRNPELHEKLIEAYDLAGDLAQGAAQREQIVTRYAKGTDWYNANLQNAKATQLADKLVEAALQDRASFHHKLAQDLKIKSNDAADAASQRRLLAESDAQYAKAVTGYRKYLAQFPHKKETTYIRWMLAEALFFSKRYLEASDAYADVREIQGKNPHRQDAGFGAIISIQAYLEGETKARRVDAKVLAEQVWSPPGKKGDRTSKIERVEKEELPEQYEKWVENSDKYVAMGLKHPTIDDFPQQQAFRMALGYYNYLHYEEARTRLEALIRKWPTHPRAADSVKLILASFETENDWQNLELWAGKVKELGIDPKVGQELEAKIGKWKLGKKFDRCIALFEDKVFVDAAVCFEEVVDRDPKSKVGDKALFNAGVAYQKAKRYNSAARLFERVATEPRFRGSKFREEALFYMAENSRRFFTFDRAISRYLSLAQAYPKSERAAYSVQWAAQLEEMQGNLDKAAQLYLRFATEFPDHKDAATNFFSAGLVYEKKNDVPRQIETWKEFLEKYASKQGTDAKVVEAHLRLGKLHQQKGSWTRAKKEYEATIEQFTSRGLAIGSRVATFPAQAKFALVDREFASYEKLKLKGSLQNQGRIIQKKREIIQQLEGRYVDVFNYKAFDWTIAAYFRIGQLYQEFAKMLYDAPEPQGLSDDEMDTYITMIEDEALKWENVAVERYGVTVTQARRLKIVNEWTFRALKMLNKYKPQEYPLFKSEKRSYDFGLGMPIQLSPNATVPPPQSNDASVDPETPKSPEQNPIPGDTEGDAAPDATPEESTSTEQTTPEPEPDAPEALDVPPIEPEEDVPAPEGGTP